VPWPDAASEVSSENLNNLQDEIIYGRAAVRRVNQASPTIAVGESVDLSAGFLFDVGGFTDREATIQGGTSMPRGGLYRVQFQIYGTTSGPGTEAKVELRQMTMPGGGVITLGDDFFSAAHDNKLSIAGVGYVEIPEGEHLNRIIYIANTSSSGGAGDWATQGGFIAFEQIAGVGAP